MCNEWEEETLAYRLAHRAGSLCFIESDDREDMFEEREKYRAIACSLSH